LMRVMKTFALYGADHSHVKSMLKLDTDTLYLYVRIFRTIYFD